MNSRYILHATGKLLQVLALVLLVPGAIALWETRGGTPVAVLSDARVLGFVLAIAGSSVTGSLLVVSCRRRAANGGIREGFAIVTLGWLLFTFFGSWPLLVYFVARSGPCTVSGLVTAFTNACFEIMSGFTTTGATILTDIEALPCGILFWRSLTHWLGGMGIVTLGLVILPAFGVAAYQMFRGEVPGPTAELLTPRVGRTASVLWGVYAALIPARNIRGRDFEYYIKAVTENGQETLYPPAAPRINQTVIVTPWKPTGREISYHSRRPLNRAARQGKVLEGHEK